MSAFLDGELPVRGKLDNMYGCFCVFFRHIRGTHHLCVSLRTSNVSVYFHLLFHNIQNIVGCCCS